MAGERVAITHRIAARWGRFVGHYGRTIIRNARLEDVSEARFPDRPCVLVSWHGSTLINLALHQRLRHRPVTALVPGGLLGAAMMAWLEVFNVDSVPITGTTFDGLTLRRLRKAVGDGHDIILAADGPVGPRLVARPGALWLGQVAKVPVVPFGSAASPAINLPRWDRHVVPFPGARVAMAIGAPLPFDIDPRSSAATELVQSTIDRLTASARAALR